MRDFSIVTTSTAKFSVGQLIQHRMFDYRGVIIDVDPSFKGSDDWYHQVARSKPPKERPWYHVLVDGGNLRTYVAERNLEATDSLKPIDHPDIASFFSGMDDSGYISRRRDN